MKLSNKKYTRAAKKFLFILIGYVLSIKYIFANNGIDKENIIPGGQIINVKQDEEALTSMFGFVRDSIFDLLALISIAVFIILGAKLIVARGNPEELKKVLMQFTYSVVGIAIVALSWAAVKLVSSLNF